MQRTNKKNEVDAIFTGDWHLREDTPICRTDDFSAAQWVKLKFIGWLQAKHNCPILLSGDVFHIWKSSVELVNKVIDNFPNNVYTVYGNHDLPQHNLKLKNKTAIANLEKNGKLTVLPGTHYRQTPTGEPSVIIKGRKILLWHVMCYTGFIPYAKENDYKPGEIMQQFPEYDTILTGHNHTSFVSKNKSTGQLVVNPGAITRQTAANTATKPLVYLWNAASNTVRPVYLPIQEEVVTREHIVVKQEKDDRLSAFISKMDNNIGASINFEENLQAWKAKNMVRKEVLSIIHSAINIQ